MFGFTSYEAEEYMPAAISYTRILCDRVYAYAKAHSNEFGVDIKIQVTIDYGMKANFENCSPQKIRTIVVSVPCVESMKIEELRASVMKLILDIELPKELSCSETARILTNPTDKYVNYSSLYDSGLTGRKLIIDNSGGYSPTGGGAQSSRDYTKVDRSGLYVARWLVKNIVAAKLTKKCIVQLSYAIGVVKPTSVSVDCMGTNLSGVDDDKLNEFVMENFAPAPDWIRDKFVLNKPSESTFLYADVAVRGQVGQKDYSWEKLDVLDKFKNLF